MQKGYVYGGIIGVVLIAFCYYLLGYGAISCGPGAGFIFSPIILIIVAACSAFQLKNKLPTVSNAAKVLLVITVIALLLFFSVFFV